MLEGSILHQLAQKHQSSDSAASQLNFGVYYKHTLVALCHALEDCVLATQDKPLVITAFQQGKWYLQEAERYSAIADCAHHITIMATPGSGFHEHPTSQRDNVTLVDLTPDDPVAQEWHLIILSPEYTAMVLCQELSPEEYGPEGTPNEDHARKFYGFWTFEPELVLETVKLAIAHIGTYNPDLQQQLSQSVEQFTINLQQSDNPPQTLEMSDVVAQVVQYLQTSRSELGQADLMTYTQALDYNLVSNELQAFLRLAQLVDLSDPTNPGGAGEVAALAEMMGQLIDMPAWQLKRLRLASVLHRIAPVQSIDSLTEESGPSCRLNPGVQALRTMPRLRAVAEIITHQHEWWNGTGQPAKLEGDAIPLESRILALASHFQAVAAQQSGKAIPILSSDASDHLMAALEMCQAQQGERWDPKLVDLLALLVQGIQQGLSLPSIPPKFTSGVGLLDPETSNRTATSTTSAN